MITKQSGAVRYSVFKALGTELSHQNNASRLPLPGVSVPVLPPNVEDLVCFQDTDMSYHCFDLF